MLESHLPSLLKALHEPLEPSLMVTKVSYQKIIRSSPSRNAYNAAEPAGYRTHGLLEAGKEIGFKVIVYLGYWRLTALISTKFIGKLQVYGR